jgi:ribosome-associated protein
MTDFDDQEFISKSQLKREAIALQELGELLLTLPPRKLEVLPLTEELREALVEYGRLGIGRGAKRRHKQYIGKLMRALTEVQSRAIQQYFSQAELLNKRLQVQAAELAQECLSNETSALEKLVSLGASIDIQSFRHLLRNVRKNSSELPKLESQLKDLLREIY